MPLLSLSPRSACYYLPRRSSQSDGRRMLRLAVAVPSLASNVGVTVQARIRPRAEGCMRPVAGLVVLERRSLAGAKEHVKRLCLCSTGESAISGRIPPKVWKHFDSNEGLNQLRRTFVWMKTVEPFGHNRDVCSVRMMSSLATDGVFKKFGGEYQPGDLVMRMQDLASKGRVHDASLAKSIRTIELLAVPVMCDFQAIQLATLIQTYGQLRQIPGDVMLAAIEKQSMHIMRTFDSQGISMLMSSFYKMGMTPKAALIHSIEGHALQIVTDFTPQGISNFLLACAQIRVKPNKNLLSALESQVGDLMDKFPPIAIANTMWSLAKMDLWPKPWLVTCFEARIAKSIRQFNSHDISKVMWAYAKAKYTPGDAVIAGIEQQILLQASNFVPQQISMTASSYSKLNLRPGAGVFEVLKEQATCRASIFNAQAIVETVFALGMLGIAPGPELARAFERRAIEVGGDFTPEHSWQYLWGMAVLDLMPPPALVAPMCIALRNCLESGRPMPEMVIPYLYIFIATANDKGWYAGTESRAGHALAGLSGCLEVLDKEKCFK